MKPKSKSSPAETPPGNTLYEGAKFSFLERLPKGIREDKRFRGLSRRADLVQSLRENVQQVQDLVLLFQRGEPHVGELLLEVYEPFLRKTVFRLVKKTWLLYAYPDALQVARMALLESFARYDASKKASPMTYGGYYVNGYVRYYLILYGQTVARTRDNKSTLPRRFVWTFSELAESHLFTKEYSQLAERLQTEDAFAEWDAEDLQYGFEQLLEFLIGDAPYTTKYVLERRASDEGWSPSAISEELGFSRQRVHQLEKSGIEKARKRARVLGVSPDDFSTFHEWVLAAIDRLLGAEEVLARSRQRKSLKNSPKRKKKVQVWQ